MSILSVDGLVKIYGRRRVVDGVCLDVAPGEIVGLLGPNGAGKTTSFKMMCGLVKPDKGRVFLQGVDVTRWPMHQRSREGGMGYLPQQSSVFGKLSAEANLKGMMQLLGFTRKQQKFRCAELLEQFRIAHIRKSLAGTLSGGERRRLEIARCLVANPKIIMLDEPFAGIDPVTVQNVQVVIKELAAAGISVLITDHAAREILQITDRTYVVSEGRILCSGTAEEIVSHEEVKRKYLGEIELPGTRVELPVGSVQPADSQYENQTADSPLAETVADIKRGHSELPDSISNKSGKPEIHISASSAHTKVSSSAIDSSQPPSNRPKIVFSKPRRSRKVVAPFRSTDLD